MAESWNAKKCEKESKRIYVDSFGTKSHMRGLQQSIPSILPTLAEGFEWVYVPTWAYRIVKTSTL